MPRFLRLIIWDALLFLVLTAGYGISQYLGIRTMAAYLVTLLTCVVCGAFLSQLSRWGIGWPERVLVGLPALYLALAPILSSLIGHPSFLPFPVVPDFLLQSAAASLRMAGALTFGFLIWNKLR